MKYGLLLMLSIIMSVSLHGQIEKILEGGDTSYIYIDAEFEILDAAIKGDTSKIKAFLKMGTDVNAQSWEGVTPLMYAALNGHLRAVEILIDSGANVNQKPYNRIDALLGASIAGHVLVADTLILNGADIESRSLNGLTPLMFAAAYDHLLLCDVLLFYGARVNTVDNYRNTPLHFSSFYGNLEVTQILVEHGALLEAQDFQGFTPLMCAAQNGHLEVVDFLIKAGSDINKTNFSNCDPLSLAILNRMYGTADYLLQNGANVNHLLSEKINLYELARETGDRNMTTLLSGYGGVPLHKISISKMITSFELNANNRDFMLGGRLSLLESIHGWEAGFTFLTRPAVRRTRYDIDEKTQYQFWEKRSLITLGAGKRFLIFSPRAKEFFGSYVSANAGYTYGSYRGAGQKPEDKIRFIPRAGLYYQYKFLDFKLGYEYFKITDSNISPHRVTLSAGFIFNLIKLGYSVKKEPRL